MEIDKKFIFFESGIFKKIIPDFIKNFENLKDGSDHTEYKISFREAWGLAIISAFRKFREPDKNWLFVTDKKISDDGFVGSFQKQKNNYNINYREEIEQVYLPHYFTRKNKENFNEYVVRFLKEKKFIKGEDYRRNKSLIVFLDVKTGDTFNWQDIVEEIYPRNEIGFLHTYFIGFQGLTDNFIKYHIFSFTNQKHRQFLNGQFNLYIFIDGSYKFEIIQEINLLKNKNR